MINKKTWLEFQNTGLLWFVNRILHVFGWAIVLQVEDDGTISDCYPARSKFRGFDSKTEQRKFEEVARFMRDNAEQLYDEAEYPPKDKP